MFEEEVTRKIQVFETVVTLLLQICPSQGQRYGAVELKDGSVLFHDL